MPAGALIFQLLNNVEPGNCIGDFNGSSTDARLGGFDACNNPKTGTGGSYGTVFFWEQSNSCPPGAGGLQPVQYWSFHWPGGGLAYPGSGTFGSGQTDQPWYENTTAPDCLIQTSSSTASRRIRGRLSHQGVRTCGCAGPGPRGRRPSS